MTTLREAAQQALEALETYATHRPLPGPCPVRDVEYALRAALAEPVQEPVATITECEACFTPDVCQLRGTCDHYAASQLRVATQPKRPAEPVEPVAWSGYDLDGMVEAFSRVIEARYQRANPFQNPIDMDAQMALRILRGFIPAMKAYTAPPQRPPLDKDALIEEFCKTPDIHQFVSAFVAGARYAERAHGIGGQP